MMENKYEILETKLKVLMQTWKMRASRQQEQIAVFSNSDSISTCRTIWKYMILL